MGIGIKGLGRGFWGISIWGGGSEGQGFGEGALGGVKDLGREDQGFGEGVQRVKDLGRGIKDLGRGC